MTINSSIDSSWTVNDVLDQFPETISILNLLGIDTCCGGNLTLSDAAADIGENVDAVIAELIRVTSEPASVR
jgi:regulator of cell morphogenesis and NO signaling